MKLRSTENEPSSSFVDPRTTKLRKHLEKHLTCGICQDIFFNSVTFISCLHVYCGACAVEWLKSHNSCPTCHKRVYRVFPSESSNAMLSLFFKLSPEITSCGHREESEILRMNRSYQPGQDVVIFSDSSSVVGDIDDDNKLKLGLTIYRSPCVCCSPNNTKGYICPEPLEKNTYLLSAPLPSSHKACTFCYQAFPVRDGYPSLQCERCRGVACPEFIGCRFAKIRRAEDQTIHLKGKWPRWQEITGFNSVEIVWLTAQINRSNLLKEYFTDETILSDPEYHCEYTKDTNLCMSCIERILTSNKNIIRDWWCVRYARLRGSDPLYSYTRPKCLYGFDCRTQLHDRDHNLKFLHACPPVPPEERE